MSKVAIIGISGDSLFYEVDHLPQKGESISTKRLHREAGGKGFNQAIACKRQGMDVYFLSAIGKDDIGKECIRIMKKEKVKAYFSYKDKNTAVASILSADNGDNEVILYNDIEIDLNDLEKFKKHIKASDALLLTYEIRKDVLKEAIRYGKENNKIIVINPAPYVYDDLDLIGDAFIVSPNENEAKKMFHMDELNYDIILKKIKDLNIKYLIITLGEKGSVLFKEDNYYKFDAVKCDHVLDTTGAGDVYNACLLSYYLDNNNIEEAIKYASYMSSISVGKKYVLDSIPRKEDYKNE